jgi:hypothetical protein
MATLNTVLHSSETGGEVGIEPYTRRVHQLSPDIKEAYDRGEKVYWEE